MEVYFTEVGKGKEGLGYRSGNEELCVRCVIFDMSIRHASGNFKQVVDYVESGIQRVSRTVFKAMRPQLRSSIHIELEEKWDKPWGRSMPHKIVMRI